MNGVLVTGATGFLGYHVTKQLNDRGTTPRVLELPGTNSDPLARLRVERCAGDLESPEAIGNACEGIETLLHTAFKVAIGGGSGLEDEMRRVNIDGTARLLDIAASKGVRRAVVIGSALAVGVNRQAVPLTENADVNEHALTLPYAVIRREAEQKALGCARSGFTVVSVAPAFTLGPDDPVGAPANKLVKAVMSKKLPFTLPVGFGCLDVRDFATGMLLAAERGISGQRYLLSGENVTANEFLQQAAAAAGVQAPRFQPPSILLHALVGAVEVFSFLRRKPPPITRSVLQIVGRYAWYDTTRARAELGWSSRPLRETLVDTVRWLQQQPA